MTQTLQHRIQPRILQLPHILMKMIHPTASGLIRNQLVLHSKSFPWWLPNPYPTRMSPPPDEGWTHSSHHLVHKNHQSPYMYLKSIFASSTFNTGVTSLFLFKEGILTFHNSNVTCEIRGNGNWALQNSHKSKIQFPNGDFKSTITVTSGHASFSTIPVEKTISPRDAEKSVPGYFSSISPFYFKWKFVMLCMIPAGTHFFSKVFCPRQHNFTHFSNTNVVSKTSTMHLHNSNNHFKQK